MPRNPEVNFYLKPEGSDKKCLIYLNFKYNKQRLSYSFGEKIAKKDWNIEKQRGKNTSAVTIDGEHSLNDLLDNLKKVLEDAYKREKVNGIPTPDQLKLHIDAFRNQNTARAEEKEKNNFFTLLDRFIHGEILKNGSELKKSTLKSYRTAKMHLLSFQNDQKYLVDFDTITNDFFDKFVYYLLKTRIHKFSKNLGIKPSAIQKTISIVQIVMRKAMALRYTKNDDFKSFRVKTNAVEDLYLSTNEIVNLYESDFSHNKKYERVRDLFVFGCFVGLRFSDLSDIKPQNIFKIDGDQFLRIIQEKTNSIVIIPCHPLVLEIFKKYSNNSNGLPPSISNQKFNEYIKEACKEAGMIEKGRITSEPEKELWQCITAHTARRSFATNFYLEGFPTIELMRITGHSSESSFLKYIKVGKQESAIRLSNHMKSKWNERLLKATNQ
jgi:integrase